MLCLFDSEPRMVSYITYMVPTCKYLTYNGSFGVRSAYKSG